MPTASTDVLIVGAGPLAEALATSFTSGNEELQHVRRDRRPIGWKTVEGLSSFAGSRSQTIRRAEAWPE
jgi:hypothetical protein